MKILVFLLACLASLSFCGAQTESSSNLTRKDSLLCKNWVLASYDQFGVNSPPEENQKKDGVDLSLNRKATVVINGKISKGNWSGPKGLNSFTVSLEGGGKPILFKVVKLSNDTLIVDYQDPTLITTRYRYSVK